MTDRIQDNPTPTSLMNDLGSFKKLSDLIGWLEKVGIRNEKISEAIREFPKLYAQAQKLVSLPDEFNAHFAKAGWIAYESFHVETMESAIGMANAGKVDEAEEFLVEHYLTEDALKFPLVRLCAHPKFQARRHLGTVSKLVFDWKNAFGNLSGVLPQIPKEEAKCPVMISRIESSMQSDICCPLSEQDAQVDHGRTIERSSTEFFGY